MRIYMMLLTMSIAFVSNAPAQSMPMQTMSGLLRLVQTSPLPTEGYMDHLAVDVKGQRLFICGEANKSLIVVDLRSGKVMRADPGGLSMEPSGKRLYVAMGDVVNGNSHIKVVDLEKREVIAEWPITGGPAPHASGLDAVNHRLFVGSRVKGGHRYEPGKLVVMDTETGKGV